MKDRKLDCSDLIAEVFGSEDCESEYPNSDVQPAQQQDVRKGDTMPCPESDPQAEPVKRGPVSVAIEAALDAEVQACAVSTAEAVKDQIPNLDGWCREVLIDQYVLRFLHLGKEAPSRISFLPMLWELQDEMVRTPSIAEEVFETARSFLLDHDFVMPGPEPLDQRRWRVVWMRFRAGDSRKSPRIIARNTYRNVRQRVKLYDVLRGLDLE